MISPFSNAPQPVSPPQSWIDLLPDELISEILSIAAAPDPPLAIKATKHIHARLLFPVTVQHVRRRWRAIALTTPELWAILHVPKSGIGNLPLYLQRSGAVPLELYAESSSPNAAVPPENRSEYLLQGVGNRIRKVDIDGENTEEIRATTLALPRHLPNLLELSIRATAYNTWKYEQLPIKAPRLRELHLLNYSVDWDSLPVSINLEVLCISDLRATSLDLKLLVRTLRTCANLRVLKLSNQLLERAKLQETSPVCTLDSLNVLELEIFYRSELNTLFRLIQAPWVESLVVYGMSDGIEGTPQSLNLNFPILTTLVVKSPDLCAELVKQLPTVKHLTLLDDGSHERMDDEFSLLLSHWKSLSRPLPLETLKTEGIPIASLLALLEHNRGDLVPSLLKLSVSVRDALLRRERSEEEYKQRAEERRKINALVELEVFGLEKVHREVEPLFETWEERELWVAERGAWGDSRGKRRLV